MIIAPADRPRQHQQHPVVVEQQAHRAARAQLRIADAITAFAGSMNFVYIHAALFVVWMLATESNPWPRLTLIVSLEAIFLSTFVYRAEPGSGVPAGEGRSRLRAEARLGSSRSRSRPRPLGWHHLGVTLDLRPFDDRDVEPAGRLLAARHAEHRRHEPLLAARFANDEEAAAEVAAAWSADRASGAVAIEGGQLVGYLLGAPKGETWGPNVWVESAGLAVQQAETVRDLYAAAAAAWVDDGRVAHYALVPSHDSALVDAWFRLAFGLQHVHAIREPLTEFTDPTVRLARHDDVPVLVSLDFELPAHQGRSPVFAVGPTFTYEEALADAAESIDHPDYAMFVVERNGRVVGAGAGCALTKSSSHTGPARPDDAGFLGFAAVLPEGRGTGAGRAVGDAVLAWAAEAGFRSVVTDWRAANLLSSRAWPRLGFRPTFFRLHRLVGY